MVGLLVFSIAGCGDLGSDGGTGGGGTGGGGTGGGGTAGISGSGGMPEARTSLFVTIAHSGEPVDDVEVCETDTDNCALTNADGKATITLPTNQEVSYTFEKEGFASILWLDVTDDTFFTGGYPMISDAEIEEYFETLMIPYPPTGGSISLLAVGRIAGVTFDLVDETTQVFYLDEDGTLNPDLTATTSRGIGRFFEVPPGEYQVEFGGNATNCVPREAWPGDAPNRTKVLAKAGFFTLAGMRCDEVP